jgi:hypothetical protein
MYEPGTILQRIRYIQRVHNASNACLLAAIMHWSLIYVYEAGWTFPNVGLPRSTSDPPPDSWVWWIVYFLNSDCCWTDKASDVLYVFLSLSMIKPSFADPSFFGSHCLLSVGDTHGLIWSSHLAFSSVHNSNVLQTKAARCMYCEQLLTTSYDDWFTQAVANQT